MPYSLEELIEIRVANQRMIDEALDDLAAGCEHTHVWRCRGASSGYIWQCDRCFGEVHGWSLYESMAADWVKEVSFAKLLDRRPPGSLRMLPR